MSIGNFYLRDGYHQNVKILDLVNTLPISKFIYLNQKIVNILLETSNIDITTFFKSNKIKTIEIYSNKFIITRLHEENWNLILAIFLSTLSQFCNGPGYLQLFTIIEKKLNNYKEYQLQNTDCRIMIQGVYSAVHALVGDTMKLHNGGFEIIELNIPDKKIHLRLIGSCSGCSLYNKNLKSVIINEIEKVLSNYNIYFYD